MLIRALFGGSISFSVGLVCSGSYREVVGHVHLLFPSEAAYAFFTHGALLLVLYVSVHFFHVPPGLSATGNGQRATRYLRYLARWIQ